VCKSTGCGHKNKPRKLIVGVNDLATTHPEIAAMAYGWDPETVTAGSHEKRLFYCSKGHVSGPVAIYCKVARKGESCSVCTNHCVITGCNDLATTHPEIAAQAYGWDPRKFASGSTTRKVFICLKGHKSKLLSIRDRVSLGKDSCAFCSGRQVLVGFNDLATTDPEIAAQAYGWDPRTVTRKSNKKKIFKCPKGHISDPVPVGRKVSGGVNSCKICSGKKVLAGFNDLATTNPEIAAQAYGWDPKTVTKKSTQLRRFRCKNGHISEPMKICNREGCKECASYGFNPTKPSLFYLVQTHDRFKFGIANHNSGRLDIHRRSGWVLVESIDMIGYAAKALEDAVGAAFKSKGIPLGQFREKFPGSTESWYKHVLPVKSIKGLCRKLGVPLAV